MEHHFSVEDAKKYGIESAILLYNIRFWIAKNKANKSHFYKDRYWTYNSAKAFSEMFPYLSRPQIARHLRKLEELGVLVSDNFNTVGYDKTKWYSILDNECTEISNPCTKLNNGSSEMNNGEFEIEQPIPDTKPVNKQQIVNTDTPDAMLKNAFNEFKAMRKKMRKEMTTHAEELLKTRLKELSGNDMDLAVKILNQSTMNNWASIYELKKEYNGKTVQETQENKIKNAAFSAIQNVLNK